MPLISFIIPVYKPRPSFDKCLKSLLDQSLDDTEIICVLDGPSPEARSTISRYVSSKISVIEIEHGGACRARNAGAEHAKSPYIVYWDSDCIIEPGAAKMWVDTFEKKPEVQFIYSGYKFAGRNDGVASRAWDPYVLKSRNFISGCFPLRSEMNVKWNEGLESLQDWAFWRSVVEKASATKDIEKAGLFVSGSAFTTDYPDKDSISGKGCTQEAWLERYQKARSLSSYPEDKSDDRKDICVVSLESQLDALMLAKMLRADYQDDPSDKPNDYKTIIQIGMSLHQNRAEHHAAIFGGPEKKKVLFWTGDNIYEIYNGLSFSAIDTYSKLLNSTAKQFVEDMAAKKLMERAGFNVGIMPLPIKPPDEIEPLPEKPIWAVDCDQNYGKVLGTIDRSLPDISLERLDGGRKISELTGIIHLFGDKCLSNTIKRMQLNGRHVISNVQSPFCGYIDDTGSREDFIVKLADKVRATSRKPVNNPAIEYYKREMSTEALLKAL